MLKKQFVLCAVKNSIKKKKDQKIVAPIASRLQLQGKVIKSLEKDMASEVSTTLIGKVASANITSKIIKRKKEDTKKE